MKTMAKGTTRKQAKAAAVPAKRIGAQARSTDKPRKSDAGASTRRTKPKKGAKPPPRLLSGGNPQIAKGYGDVPVQAYIAAMSGGGPGWKRDVGRRLDAIIVRVVPNVRKAVKWNSPLYGAAGEEGTWFLGIHCFAKYIKVAFFRGASLRPLPPGESKQKDVRFLDVREGEELDEAQFARWVKQASKLPGERL